MSTVKSVELVLKSRPTVEGAGVRLKRAIGPRELPLLDPFLLLDDFHSDDSADYIAGFPWHPHRGIETVTYMIRGLVDHGDSLGNKGSIRSGDTQWMTAGGGILHQEMPQPFRGNMQGFQLWVNLPARKKMMEPRYRDVTRDNIPNVSLEDDVNAKVIAGSIGGTKGPVKDLVVDCSYFDISMPPTRTFEYSVQKDHRVFAYVFEGAGTFDPDGKSPIGPESVVVFGKGDRLVVTSGRDGARFLLVSGEPLKEPVAWGGPIVMNTQEELDLALEELKKGTFIKKR